MGESSIVGFSADGCDPDLALDVYLISCIYVCVSTTALRM